MLFLTDYSQTNSVIGINTLRTVRKCHIVTLAIKTSTSNTSQNAISITVDDPDTAIPIQKLRSKQK